MPRWLLYSILTVLFWGIWGFIPRKLGALPAEQHQLLSILGLLPIMAVLAWRRERLSGTRIRRGCWIALAAGLVASVGNLFFYRLINSGQSAATVVPLTSLYPLVTVVLAVLILKEKLHWIHGAGIGLALVSIYFFNVGREEPPSARWLALALLPILLWGVAALLQKLCTNDLSAELSTLGFLAALAIGSLALLATPGLTWRLSAADWGWGVALGLSLGLGNLTLLAAFASGGQAAIVSPLTAIYSVITVPLAVGLLGEKVGAQQWLAIALAVAAVVALAWTPTAKASE
jgi:drug/metabolite transporter (DMT)-like permease